MMNGNLIFSFWFLFLCIAALTCDGRQGDHLTRLMNAKNVKNIDYLRGFHVQNVELAQALIAQEGSKATDKVQRLPGQLNNVNFTQYGGYVTVDGQAGRALFYYFAGVNGADPSSQRLVLWLNGGLGCSSLGIGAFRELGPFRVHSDGKTLYENIFAWNKGIVGGYTEEYKGDLTLVTVRGAGHEVSSYQPARALTLIDFFLKRTSLPSMSTFN